MVNQTRRFVETSRIDTVAHTGVHSQMLINVENSWKQEAKVDRW